MEQLKLRVRNGICICFTAQGKETATRLLEKLSQQMEEAFDFLDYTGSEHSKPLKQVVKEAFQEKEAILFVGAAGIAVRLIAPWVQDKLKDPAVLVIDEQGRYAIPILSGHVGGCNELAEAAAQILGAEPVITTATDLRQAFAVDVFAAENELVISDRELAKQISAAELRGEKIGFFSDYPVDGIVPAEITPGVWQKENIYVTLKQGGCPKNAPASLVRRDMVIGLQEKKEQRDAVKAAAVVAVETGDSAKAAEIDMSVGKSDIGSPGQKSEQKKEQSYESENESGTPELLRLYPRTVVLGMGCRRDSSLNAVREMARVALSRAMIDKSAVRAIATVDRKKNEMAFLALAKEWDVELWSFTPEELESAGTKFAESPFVRKTVGVGNVCERAAVMGVRRIYREREMDEKNLPAIDLRVQKMAFNGVTAAVTVRADRILRESQVIIGYTVYVDLVKEFYPQAEFLTTPMRQEKERCEMALKAAQDGRKTAMICSGDSGVYGMAGLVLQMAEAYPDVNVEVIPGVTAALGGGAILGAPLGHDFAVISLSDLLTPMEVIEKRLRAAAEADFIICLYNPSSRKRHDYLERACRILLEYKSGETACGYVQNIGREGEAVHLLTLAELEKTPVDMFTTVFIGNKETQMLNGCLVTPRGYRDV